MSDLTPQERREFDAIKASLEASLIGDELLRIDSRMRSAENADLHRRFRAGTPPLRTADGAYVYAEVDAKTVSAAVRGAALRGFAVGKALLGVEVEPDLHWFAAETELDLEYMSQWGRREWSYIVVGETADGAMMPGFGIWLSAGLGSRRAFEVAAHELHHLVADDPDADEATNEAAAQAFGLRALEEDRRVRTN